MRPFPSGRFLLATNSYVTFQVFPIQTNRKTFEPRGIEKRGRRREGNGKLHKLSLQKYFRLDKSKRIMRVTAVADNVKVQNW
jgi:hypothetical protein